LPASRAETAVCSNVAAARRRGLAVPAIAVAAALWAVAAVVASELFERGVAPFELAAARVSLAAAGLALLPSSWRGAHGQSPDLVAVAGLGLSLALVTFTYYVAIDRLPVAVAIVLQYKAPALVVAYTSARARRRPSPATAACLVAALVGVALVTGALERPLERLESVGLAAGVGAAVFFASYALLGERARRSYGAVGVMLRAFAVASAFWIAVQIGAGWPGSLFAAAALRWVVFVGVAGTLLPFLLFVWAIGHVRAGHAAIAATLEPVLAALAAWIWLGERLSALQLAGGGLVVAAVAWLQASQRGASSP
jgi:DME family drug/metabolite transporter